MSPASDELTEETLATLRRGYGDSYGDWLEGASDVCDTAGRLDYQCADAVYIPEVQHGLWRYQRDQHGPDFVRSQIEAGVRRRDGLTVEAVIEMLNAVAERWDEKPTITDP